MEQVGCRGRGRARGSSVPACFSVISYRAAREIPGEIMKSDDYAVGRRAHGTSLTVEERGAEPVFGRGARACKGLVVDRGLCPPAATERLCEGKPLLWRPSYNGTSERRGGASSWPYLLGTPAPATPCWEARLAAGAQPYSLETASLLRGTASSGLEM